MCMCMHYMHVQCRYNMRISFVKHMFVHMHMFGYMFVCAFVYLFFCLPDVWCIGGYGRSKPQGQLCCTHEGHLHRAGGRSHCHTCFCVGVSTSVCKAGTLVCKLRANSLLNS